MVSRPYDVAVIGAGIVGLASALKLAERHPKLRLAVVDKEERIGAHQTSHNSGVVHRGVYYTPGSLKARLCVQGADELIRLCDAHGIAVQRCGKLIVAVSERELPALDELARRGRANGVPGLERVDRGRLEELQPGIAGLAALYSPETAIVDFAKVAQAMAADVEAGGGELLLGRRVQGISPDGAGAVLTTSAGEVRARHVISCAGLWSDRVAAMTDPRSAAGLRIIPFRGDYWVVRPDRAAHLRRLVYPVPDPRFPFLGVHFTLRHDGEVWAGPNAVLAFAREGYRRSDLRPRELLDVLRFPGFWRMAGRYWRTGAAELWRDYVKGAFLAALRRYDPDLRADDLLPGPSGVRAQAVRRDGSLVDDFVLDVSERAIHVRNAPSPAATSSLAIGAHIADAADAAFGLAST